MRCEASFCSRMRCLLAVRSLRRHQPDRLFGSSNPTMIRGPGRSSPVSSGPGHRAQRDRGGSCVSSSDSGPKSGSATLVRNPDPLGNIHWSAPGLDRIVGPGILVAWWALRASWGLSFVGFVKLVKMVELVGLGRRCDSRTRTSVTLAHVKYRTLSRLSR